MALNLKVKTVHLGLIFLFLCALPAGVFAEETPQLRETSTENKSIEEVFGEAKSNMVRAPQKALEAAKVAESLAADSSAPDALAMSLWLQGEALTRLNRAGEALPIIERARNAVGDEKTKLAADILLAQGRAERDLSRYGSALSCFQDAYLIYAELGIARSSALALQSIGTLYDSAHQYERVVEYYERASDAFSDGAVLDLVSLNNRANAYRELERYEDASSMLNQALEMARESAGNVFTLRILTNLAVLEVRRGNLEAANVAIEEALTLSTNEEAKGWRPFIWGAKAQVEKFKGDNKAARSAIVKTFEGADLTATPPSFRDAHQTAAEVYEELGEASNALTHAKAFKRIDDEGRDIAASANLALMNAEFEVSNKELQIARLKSEQLEKDIALAAARTRQERTLATAGACLGAVIVATLFYAFATARRRQKASEAFSEVLEGKNIELTDANAALEKANQAKMEFLATTSHEVRTPLNAIIGLSDVVLNGDAIIDRDRDYLKTVNESGRHLLSIVNDILDISKMEAGHLIIDKDATDVAGIVGAVAGIWRKAAEDKGIDLKLTLPECEMGFETDGRLVRQTVSNLLSNAVKFTKEGSIDVALTRAEDSGFVLTVSDSGVGIPEDAISAIFEPFKQADGRLQREYGGTGLGLAICRKIAEALGGEINVQSTVGKGDYLCRANPCRIQSMS